MSKTTVAETPTIPSTPANQRPRRAKRARQRWSDAAWMYLIDHPVELVLRDLARLALQAQGETETPSAIRHVTFTLAQQLVIASRLPGERSPNRNRARQVASMISRELKREHVRQLPEKDNVIDFAARRAARTKGSNNA